MEIYKPLSWLYLSGHLISRVHIPNLFSPITKMSKFIFIYYPYFHVNFLRNTLNISRQSARYGKISRSNVSVQYVLVTNSTANAQIFRNLVFASFYFFHQMMTLQKLLKMLFISSKTLFSFSRYSDFCHPPAPAPAPSLHTF